MSVNISGHQFARQELLEQVDNVIAASGINPGNLMFEITESVLLADWDLSISLMQALKERGIKLAIDDFGTGYSSLSYLHRFPVDTLKIDRSFVAAIGTVREKPEIIRTVLALARDLRLDIVAEGVETTAQFQHLLELGCEYAQGFLFAKPLTAREATGFLNTRVV
jgi:EAL domain-containing protein (putative c-di-GMP-specific phosphodiesterase class I)